MKLQKFSQRSIEIRRNLQECNDVPELEGQTMLQINSVWKLNFWDRVRIFFGGYNVELSIKKNENAITQRLYLFK